MNPNKIFKWLGLLFVAIGIVVFIGSLLVSTSLGRMEGILFGIFFLVIFGGIGGFFAGIGIRSLRSDDQILKDGNLYLGKIFQHKEDHSVLMNGKPLLQLVVRYYGSDATIQEAEVKTGIVDDTLYPIGSTVQIKVLNGRAALVKDSVSDQYIPGEADLMNPDFDPKGIHSSVNVNCPGCGAPIDVPYGMARICPYCGRKISLTEDGKVI